MPRKPDSQSGALQREKRTSGAAGTHQGAPRASETTFDPWRSMVVSLSGAPVKVPQPARPGPCIVNDSQDKVPAAWADIDAQIVAQQQPPGR